MKRKFAAGYVVASVATLAVAALLFAAKKPKLAAAVIVASPVPCPPGLPC